MFFQPLEKSLIQQNNLLGNDQKILQEKIKKFEKETEIFNTNVNRFLTIANKKNN